MLFCILEFIPIVEVNVFVSLLNFISKFPLYFATTRLMLLVPIPCIPEVILEDTRVPLMYLGFLLQEFEILIITKFEFLVQIEKSINLSSVNNADSTAFSNKLSNKAVISCYFIKSRFAFLMLIVKLILFFLHIS